MKSPIKYYGGKSYMTNIIINQFPDPATYDVYVEGLGGAHQSYLPKSSQALKSTMT
jgi:hypothetical protein